MIRNYYTEAYKGGIVPAISATNLIDGRTKIIQSVPSGNHNAMAATSRVVILTTVVLGIERNMFATAPAAGTELAWTINDAMLVESVVYSATTTTITFTTAKAIAANTVITFFSVNQSSWNEYNLFIGTSPSSFTIQNNVAVTGTNTLVLNTPDPRIQVGMSIGGIGIGASKTVAGIAADNVTLTISGAVLGTVPVNTLITYSFTVSPSVSVLTVSNQTITFTNPAQGFVLPVSVVQVTGVAGGLTNLIALE